MKLIHNLKKKQKNINLVQICYEIYLLYLNLCHSNQLHKQEEQLEVKNIVKEKLKNLLRGNLRGNQEGNQEGNQLENLRRNLQGGNKRRALLKINLKLFFNFFF